MPQYRIPPQEDTNPFFYLNIRNASDAFKLINMTGKFKTKSNKPILISLSPDLNDKSATNYFMQNKSTILRDQTLNLSNLRDSGYRNFTPNSNQISFLLFLGAITAIEDNIEINTIRLENNALRNPKIFFNITANFPHLKSVFLTGNFFTPENYSILTQNGISINNATADLAGYSARHSEKSIYKAYLSSAEPQAAYFAESSMVYKPVAEVVGFPEEEENELDAYEPFILDPYVFPTNKFFNEFFEYGLTEIDSLLRFYAPKAVFSISVDDCAPGSPLSEFKWASRNLNEESGELVIGSNEIIERQLELFGDGFRGYPLQFQSCKLSDFLYAVVFHGVLLNQHGKLVEFDRSFTATPFEEGFRILNDHIFLRNHWN